MTDLLITLPFLIGFLYLLVLLTVRGLRWIRGLSLMDRLRLRQALLSKDVFSAAGEAFMEGLLHRKIFRKHPVLGYMHMSLAFGWFLLIVVGHIETLVADRSLVVPVYKAVFFRYFETSKDFTMAGSFAVAMDLLLLFVLSGVSLAMAKRFRKHWFGLRQTTRLKTGDRIALTSLWLIFPLRLAAEATAASLWHNGSFLTNPLGSFIGSHVDAAAIHAPLWFAYSSALGFFFVALPNSRYMHIPAEILLIFMRRAGVRLKKINTTYTEVQVYSCSRCGICLDRCQLSVAGIRDTQTVYLLKSIRNRNLTDESLFNCLMCGKCQVDCPVGIDTVDLRLIQRIESTMQYNSSYAYLKNGGAPAAEVIYFAGCMTHLSPGIIRAVRSILEVSGQNYWFMDEEKAPCCGRPLLLAGQYDAARELIVNNRDRILASGAHTLLVSCPICYKVFSEDYELGSVKVVMHAEYILRLIQEHKILLHPAKERLVYHDPCELGRGMGMYTEPREVLKECGELVKLRNEKERAHCCGGSLGNLKITQQERNLLRDQALQDYFAHSPDVLVTACPLCKKTFARGRQILVQDIAEVVAGRMLKPSENLVQKSVGKKKILDPAAAS